MVEGDNVGESEERRQIELGSSERVKEKNCGGFVEDYEPAV